MTDVRDLHRRSVEVFVGFVSQVGDDSWQVGTPCEGWTVHDLVNHVVGEELWTVPLLDGATIAEVGDRFDGDVLGADPIAATRSAASAATGAADGADLDRVVHLSFGDVPAQFYLEQLFADHLVHSWDLASAIGVEYAVPPDLVDECTTWFESHEAAYRAAGVIGDRPADLPAGGVDRMLVMFGRNPRWTADG
ncbi:MAG: TIGR03086 family metal-binding protein [Acidimicrobiia bacterium]|nr:TIGR03086 family metal-binding protein [Acidimicrobiia bacterium]MDH4309190.1 TIGR03086 family metal-binding protein [Acidimicrobiia bacterium]MDH5295462.1 TIGR03086 family metal-binding protein [Acidimicrobiia bacterium]